jgi:hypothetical protein
MSSLDISRDAFFKELTSTLTWLSATEALWLGAPPTTEVRMKLKVPQLEALYESAFLRIFTFWEVFLEDSTVRLMARSSTISYAPAAAAGKKLYRSLSDSRTALYGGRDYLLWHDPIRSADRVAHYLVSSPVELELRSRQYWLMSLAQVRHRIAHASADADNKFRAAALDLTGATFRSRPGRLLRGSRPANALNPKKWILVFCDELQDSVDRICN